MSAERRNLLLGMAIGALFVVLMTGASVLVYAVSQGSSDGSEVTDERLDALEERVTDLEDRDNVGVPTGGTDRQQEVRNDLDEWWDDSTDCSRYDMSDPMDQADAWDAGCIGQ